MFNRLLLVVFVAALSFKKAESRGCNAAEVQDMADCLTTEFRANELLIGQCFKTNNCSRDYYFQRRGDNQNQAADSQDNNEDAVFQSQFSIFNESTMGRCLKGYQAYVQQLVAECVVNDPSMAGSGFKYPKLPDEKSDDSTTYGTSSDYSACKLDSLDACLQGRQVEDICPLMRKCGKEHCGTCNITLTMSTLCKCGKKIYQERFEDLKANLTKCLNPPSTWKLNITESYKQHLIERESQVFCMNCFQAAPSATCTTNDVIGMSTCMQSTLGSIDQCYRSSNCPRPVGEIKGAEYESANINMANLFASIDGEKLATCGMSLHDELMKQIGSCIQKQIPTIDFVTFMNGMKNDSNHQGNRTNENGDSQQQQGSCNQAALDTCLAGRKWNAEYCDIEQDCARSSTNCDVSRAKSVGCSCAQQYINLNSVTDNMNKLFQCAGMKSAPTLDDQQKSFLLHSVLHDFCNCVPNYNPNGPPQGAAPPPVRRPPAHPEVAPVKPPKVDKPSPQAAQFVTLLRGNNG